MKEYYCNLVYSSQPRTRVADCEQCDANVCYPKGSYKFCTYRGEVAEEDVKQIK